MDFFTFYTEIKELKDPFVAFHLHHLITLALLFMMIFLLLRHYRRLDVMHQERFQKGMAIYFLVEEFIYSLWLILNCHEHLWQELLPLQLCSLCVYVAVASVYFKRTELRFFSGVVGTLAGLTAIIYPANISQLYPAFSYRTINFFMLHGAFILFGLIQLQDESLLRYGNIKRCNLLLSIMVFTAFFVNLQFHTNYMFLGVPSSIGFIRMVYRFTGMVLFLPVVMIILTGIQALALFVFRRLSDFYHKKQEASSSQTISYE